MGWLHPVSGRAGTVVVRNRTAQTVDFAMALPDAQASRQSLQPGELVSLPVASRLAIGFDAGGKPRQYVLGTNSIHYFFVRDGQLDLIKLGLASPPGNQPLPATPVAAGDPPPITVPVMLLVDDEEQAVRHLWEQRLRERLAQASAIFERHCGVRFEVAAVGTWDSHDGVRDFNTSLKEFEMEVDPAAARLAIGFSSQYSIPVGRTHLGGTRGALYSHILIREWSQHIDARQRLEVLVHELGHFLGASHTQEYDSVMRATLGDKYSLSRRSPIGFDALNTLIMSLVAEELRSRPVQSLRQLHPTRRAQLRQLYETLARTMPDDDATKYYLRLISGVTFFPWTPAADRQVISRSGYRRPPLR
ncbi:MAG TPA: M12 family metallo-peptidase [Thermoguttaceae bacterium]|nr:M12 family metallo-peptidase [Thermoguttaceae bacterium]